MAKLSNCTSGHSIYLRAQHVFGRDPLSDTLLDSPGASRLHAAIHWTGQRWELRDLSRHGSLVDGVRVPTACPVPLRLGSLLSFTADGCQRWCVEDLAGPAPMLLPLDGGTPVLLGGANPLPPELQEALRLVLGERGQWLCCHARGAQPLSEGEEVRMGGRRWCFASGTDPHLTPPGLGASMGLDGPTALELRVSLDEEHAWLKLHHFGHVLDLGERSHHYTLLTLARMRMQDAERGVSTEAQGWVEHGRLASMLGIDGPHLNIQLFRLRQQIAQAVPHPLEPPTLVERRRGALRLQALPCRVLRGQTLQGSYEPWRLAQASPWADARSS
ncbi:FHA domain-containing protein [Mitsuaria sp. WAJ17]|uniref:FHA domain-containing protein n=1 Tax=Mitsuaria sp. WAJ17 TaxID=2761452 RepID=UPI0016043AD4|nr:FHA domain-containing protein [Mitsuaria sp. WAJ17]MBB2484558.1 FHA domain-containing protein [Mitsuaria sp. WAJ17]